MYSVVLATMLAAGGATPAWHNSGGYPGFGYGGHGRVSVSYGCSGCYGNCYGCGGCYGERAE